MSASTALDVLRERCARRGLDVCGACALRAYEDAIERVGTRASMRRSGDESDDGKGDAATTTSNAGDDALVCVVGNSKALWPMFVEALRRDGGATVDAFARRAIESAAVTAAARAGSKRFRVYWATDLEPGKVVAIQRLAATANVAYFDDATHQSLHPTHGPWCAFRAAVVFDDVRTEGEIEPGSLACPVSAGALRRAKEAFDVAVERYGNAANKDEMHKLWLAARIAMEDGEKFRECRYYDDQILWHYDVNRTSVRDRIVNGGGVE